MIYYLLSSFVYLFFIFFLSFFYVLFILFYLFFYFVLFNGFPLAFNSLMKLLFFFYFWVPTEAFNSLMEYYGCV